MTDTVETTMSEIHARTTLARMSRRTLLGGTAGAIVLFALDASPLTRLQAAIAAGTPAPAAVNGWIAINPDNTVTIGFGGAEMGQGIMTGLAQGAAEELMVEWAQVQSAATPTGLSFISAGSYGIRGHLGTMRLAGAQAREMLRSAAATQWGVDPSQCSMAAGVVTNTASGATLTYAALASAAAALTPPDSPVLTDPSAFRIIGTTAARVDLSGKVNGKAQFGIDARVPGMVFAAIKHCPTFGGTVVKTPTTPAGTLGVVNLGNAVAVVATNSWAAMNSAANLTVSWTTPAGVSALTSSTILTTAQSLMATGTPGSPLAEQIGDAPTAFTSAATKVDSTYTLPFLPHVMMEVPNCTVSLTRNGAGAVTAAEVWVPTQAASWVMSTVAGITGLASSAVTVHPTLLGGGLGRKVEQDYVSQAVKVAMAITQPVQLVWAREEDLAHDQYRPMGLVRVRLGADSSGVPAAFHTRIVAPSVLYQRGWMAPTGNDTIEGAVGLSYAIPNKLVEYVRHPTTVPVGFWRSIGDSINCFAVESALDELALALGTDPVALHVQMLSGNARGAAVVSAAASGLGWTTPPASVSITGATGTGTAQTYATASAHGFIVGQTVTITGIAPAGYNKTGAVITAVTDTTHFTIAGATSAASTSGGAVTGIGRGISYSEGDGSLCAVALEVAQPAVGGLRVTRASIAIDCGIAVNPGQVEAQMQGGFIQGISSALWGQTTWASGKASSRNFSNTRVLRMAETPAITVQIIQSGMSNLGGVGEAGVPLAAPAIANAYARLTGTRVRTLPFFPAATMGA